MKIPLVACEKDQDELEVGIVSCALRETSKIVLLG